MQIKPMVYIAGPISSNPMHGTHNAVSAATRMLEDGFAVPFVPHLTVLWDMIEPHDYEFWMSYDFDVIASKCDALLRLPGASAGADREVRFAVDCEIPVFFRYEPLADHFRP